MRQNKKRRLHQSPFFLGGKKGIRTPEALLTLTRFPGGPLQPLEHLSVDDFFFSKSGAKVQLFSDMTKKMYLCSFKQQAKNLKTI